ncbi:MAG: penicillin acylase family protein [Caldilineaceae bacterium]|nr:penicillin acylase family protein [Caldilineaceae bacterium]
MWKWVRRIGFVLLAALIIGLAGGYFYLRTSLPKTTGTVQIARLEQPVEIIRDEYGVPHIFAATDHDAVMALGYVHAQDRMWQMEFQRRIGAGRLSEILGEATLSTDKFLRTLGPYRAAETAWPALSSDTQALLSAYADGVNAWLDEGHTLPPEFLILGVKPAPWTEMDSMVWAKMMAWDLGGDWDLEILRAALTQTLGPERAAQLLPAYPEDGIAILAASDWQDRSGSGLLEMDTLLQEQFDLGGIDVGSNNWVIGGARTETGRPILANDMHLSARIPSIWYLAELHGDALHISGMTFPGLPLLPSGHNENIAWGVTNVDPDVQDLYMEEINPANPNQYRVGDEWADMDIVEELIYVDGQEEPIPYAARSTRHGPLISDATDAATAVAMRWTALDAGDSTVEAYTRVNYARNWDEFVAAMRDYVAPSQSFVYADKGGNIGYFAPGHIPIRANHDGMLPVPGWNGEYEWTGWIPFDDLPRTLNPAAGFVATANNKIVDDSYPYLISNDWSEPYRAERITQLIEAMSRGDERISLADVGLIHGDQYSAQVDEILPALLALTPNGERQAQAMAILADWDGALTRDTGAPAIYSAWQIALGRALFADDLRGDLYDEMAARAHPLLAVEVMREPEQYAAWCDNILTAPSESCAETALEALDTALDDLSARMGDDMRKWTWGAIHKTQYPHNPFSEVPLLKPIFHRSIENGGDAYTVDIGPVRQTELYNQYHVVSQRSILDVGAWNNSLIIHTTGQSGNVLSRHYDDFIRPHRDVEYIPMTWGRENVTGDVLTLEP